MFSQAGAGGGEERVGEHARGHVPVPGGPFADLVLVRKWTPWHRHVSACMLAHAFLAATRAQLGKPHPPQEVVAAR